MTTQTSSSPEREATTAGNYFISNYPPYSFWKTGAVPEAMAALERPARPGVPLGIYLHIPFCRKRCHFCYFKVYTDRNSTEIRQYQDAVLQEMEIYAGKPFVSGRKPKFIYFGGGTPSYLSSRQLIELTDGMKALFPWDEAEEVTFEAEPGTLSENKLRTLRDLGVTRLSFGVENFDERILEINGRAHRAKEIDRAYGWAKSMDFPQINIDLIAGMLEETEANWHACVEKAITMEPGSITIYQMEIPYNTTIYQRMKDDGKLVAPVADWETKRAWVDWAFARLESAGYRVSSAYTAVREPEKTKFIYRDQLWRGADLMSVGVSSFSHINGTHYQNQHHLHGYFERVNAGELPIFRALTPNDEELLIRELVLQFKLGSLGVPYFREKYGVDIRERFAGQFEDLAGMGVLETTPERLLLSREGLLKVDQLLPRFFLPQHQNARYA